MSERQPMTHVLKCVEPFYGRVADRSKLFEVRRDDRDFQPGDTVVLRKFDGRFYGNSYCVFGIGYVLRGFPGLNRFYCAFSLLDPTDQDDDRADAAMGIT